MNDTACEECTATAKANGIHIEITHGGIPENHKLVVGEDYRGRKYWTIQAFMNSGAPLNDSRIDAS